MSYLVIDLTDADDRRYDQPFGKFGPFDTRAEAELFIRRLPHPESYMALPSKLCR